MAPTFAARRNDWVRALLQGGVLLAGKLSSLQVQRRLPGYAREQERLRHVLGVTAQTPIRRWGPDVQENVDSVAARQRVEYASTSGSTSTPKRMCFVMPYFSAQCAR